ncbi:sodium-dependent transporter [Pontibacter ramchanderi]|uniref:SNF family Na+-dependent transporter n=1 Tax=Pontibacter ramchanderi TaxID=1179743 RepID=A0A2N3UB90_9BACT|nr:sodium-dependent transporter [Pontibacter ramchanderi]PKV66629.1 SNF family Na+-dependent transporter [Pontibacter ramchanderi]
MSANKESWGSRVGLILAMAGNAVGLGNFLRFPVQAVQNGGGAFIIPYLVCFLVMGIPLLWIEWSMGRFGGKFGHHSTPFIVDTMHRNRLWKYIGVFGIWTNIAVASYYCYLESWTLSYVFHSLAGTFSGLDQNGVSAFFDEYVSLGDSTFGIPYEPILFFVICLLLNTWILSQGLAKGVERVAKIGMPLLILFGMFLAYKGFTITAGENGAINDSSVGLNFLWTPNFDELWSPTVWLAAAGQIFFTLSVGMGTIHCYASYVRSKDDIALNAMSAGWMNEFVEVVLGASILIPISIGYLGIDGVVNLVNSQGGLGLGFRTLPYLFYQWGDVLGAVAGVMWFGLLFFAGITSSLAMGTPWMGFLQDEFNWRRRPAAWSFGLIVLLLGMPTVLFFEYGVFDEYDYWAGTVSLVVFALFESILFAWVFGMNKGWREITSGADIKVPGIYKFIIKFITPLLLLWVFIGSLITPKGGDWAGAFRNGWVLDDGSIISKIKNTSLKRQLAEATDPAVIEQLQDTLFFVNASRILLVAMFLSIAVLVYMAYKKRVREGRI